MKELICILFLMGCVKHVTSIEEGEFAAVDLSGHGKIPPYEASIQNPVPSDEASIQRGQRLYLSYCASCHGMRGHGDGPRAAGLDLKPSDLSRVSPARNDYQIFLQMSLGGMGMPQRRSDLTETDRWNIVNFIRTL